MKPWMNCFVFEHAAVHLAGRSARCTIRSNARHIWPTSSCSGRCGRRRGGPARPGGRCLCGRAGSSTGTRTFVVEDLAVVANRGPRPGRRARCSSPGVSVGTMICVILPRAPPAPSGSSVRHMTMEKSARLPFEVNHLWPLMTHSSPSRTARVWMRAGSEPGLSGSVIEKPDSISPSMSGLSHFFFCSSVPYLTRIVWLPEFGATTPNSAVANGAQASTSFM